MAFQKTHFQTIYTDLKLTLTKEVADIVYKSFQIQQEFVITIGPNAFSLRPLLRPTLPFKCGCAAGRDTATN